MSDYARLRVHIAPLGFEVDRIVLPAVKMKADKVWILIDNDSKQDKAKSYLIDIKAQLKQEKIDFEVLKLNRLNLFSTIRAIRQIIEEEKQHSYYVNVSSGSKIQAVACTMATMMFNENNNLFPYYVEPEKYFPFKGKPQSTGMKHILDLPQYDIQIPDQKLIKTLNIIDAHNGRISKKDLADITDKSSLIEIGAKEENYEQARFASLDKNIIHPLKDRWGLITEEKIGRTRWLILTEEGKNVKDILS